MSATVDNLLDVGVYLVYKHPIEVLDFCSLGLWACYFSHVFTWVSITAMLAS